MNKGYFAYLTPFTKIIFVVMMVIVGLLLAVLGGLLLTMIQYHVNMTQATLLLGDFNNPASLPLLKELQIVESIFMFILPALILGYLFEGDRKSVV